MQDHIVVISGSAPLDAAVVDMIPEASIVIAVDGALDHALAAGLAPSGLVGDLDSVSADGLAWAREHATVAGYPADKNQTDTELALAFAADMDPSRLTLIGGGDRLDHTMAAIGALGHRALISVPAIDGWWSGMHVDVLHGPGQLTLDLPVGSTMSLLALHGPCRGVHISGVRWPLTDATLDALVGHGVSNVVDDDTVEVRISTGVLTIFDTPHRPDATTRSPTDPLQEPS